MKAEKTPVWYLAVCYCSLYCSYVDTVHFIHAFCASVLLVASRMATVVLTAATLILYCLDIMCTCHVCFGAQFMCLRVSYFVFVYFLFIVFGCQYQCN